MVIYIDWIANECRVRGQPQTRALKKEIPLFGPRFVPPTFLDTQKRSLAPQYKPETTYLKSITAIHPFYFPQLANCPRCGSKDISWNGWNTSGHRDVHGLRVEETAIGFQLQCATCQQQKETEEDVRTCFSTTNPKFWEFWDHWKIPRKYSHTVIRNRSHVLTYQLGGIPYFFKRCAVTRELFDLIIEFRLSTTSGGLEENVKRKSNNRINSSSSPSDIELHLLEYHQRRLEYIDYYATRIVTSNNPSSCFRTPPPFLSFSAPSDAAGYNDTSITHDLITEVYLEFSERTRSVESTRYTQTLTGK